jgi:hypothetical protein
MRLAESVGEVVTVVAPMVVPVVLTIVLIAGNLSPGEVEEAGVWQAEMPWLTKPIPVPSEARPAP